MYDKRLRIYASNRLEILLEQLAETLRSEPLPPLEREVVVVQSRGMYRWLTLEIARRLGIAATLATPFPGTFVRALRERIEGATAAATEHYEPTTRSLFDPEPLSWSIFALLGGSDAAITGPASHYLADDPDQRKRHQLAVRLAERFDELELYRLDWLEAWERGGQPIDDSAFHAVAQWQAALWRMLVEHAASHGERSPVARQRDLHAALARDAATASTLPQRLHVFAASTLPPQFLELLGALARRSEVAIYVVEPTPEHWSELRPSRVVERQRDLFREHGLEADDAHAEVGNALLASLGRQGRELHTLLQELDGDGSAWTPLRFVVPKRDSVLAVLQADICEVVDRRRGADAQCPPPIEIARGDRSLEIHVCHSPMREMEALRDVLLDAFATDPALRPDDVFVLAPDIAGYAPYIEAVFGVERADEPVIPFTIADRSTRHEQPVLQAAMRILDLVGTHVAASSVAGLLDFAAVRRAAAIDADEAAIVRDWVRTANIHWGIDGEHREQALGLAPGDDLDTWRTGIDRLLMGYAVSPSGGLVAGILPSAVAASHSDLIGRAAAYLDTLLDRLRALAAPRPLDRWSADLADMLDRLLAIDTEIEQQALQTFRDLVRNLADDAARCAMSEPVTVEVVRSHLRARLDAASGGAGFLTGAITFCALEPMRAIPAKLLCIVGLDDGAFPRMDRRSSFDLLTAGARRGGDRSPRDEDRQLFLDTLLAARQRLVLSYVGRSHKDNAELAPSIVLSELLDHVDRCFTSAASSGTRGARSDGACDSRASRALIVEHALQPFSETYFVSAPDGGAERARFSFSRVNHAAAQALQGARKPARGFAATPLQRGAGLAEGIVEVSLAELTQFWADPSRAFCRNVLGLRLPDDAAEIRDAEPFAIGGLERYTLAARLLERRLAGLPAGETELDLLRADGVLPHAGFAFASYEKLRERTATVARAVEAIVGTLPCELRTETIDIDGRSWRVGGVIERVSERRLIRARAGSVRPKDEISAWVAHLALNAWCDQLTAAGLVPALPRTTVVVGVDRAIELRPVEDARALLDALVEGYREGATAALPVFADASYAFAQQKLSNDAPGSRSRKSPWDAARSRFDGSDGYRGNSRIRGDVDDPYVALCTRDRNPFDADTDEFERRALALWEPVFAHRSEIEP